MAENDEGRALEWDDAIENDGEDFSLLPEGSEVSFTVTKLEKGQSAKLRCPMAIITLKCVCDAGRTNVTENLILHSSCEWKLCQFFTAIGQRKHGEKLVPRWNEVIGATGNARLTIEKWTNRNGVEKESNKVKNFLNPVQEDAAFG